MLLDQPASSFPARIVFLVLFTMIILSTLCVVLASEPAWREQPSSCDWRKPTVEDCEPRPQYIFCVIESICVLVFTLDYLPS